MIKEVILSSREHIFSFVHGEEILARNITIPTKKPSEHDDLWSYRGINELLGILCYIFKLNEKLFWCYYDPKMLRTLIRVDRTLPVYGHSLCHFIQTVYYKKGLDGDIIPLTSQRHSFYKKLFILQILEGNVKRNFSTISLLIFLLDSLSSEHYLVIEYTSLFIVREGDTLHLGNEDEIFATKMLVAKLLHLEKQIHIPLRLKSFILDAVVGLTQKLAE